MGSKSNKTVTDNIEKREGKEKKQRGAPPGGATAPWATAQPSATARGQRWAARAAGSLLVRGRSAPRAGAAEPPPRKHR